ncbi:MAG: hypothetical protein RIQ89_1817 [Bacteroidota bacterium]|jgi:hypothetical protein
MNLLTKRIFLLLFFFLPNLLSLASSFGEKWKHATYYFGWGYNRDWYSKGNVHLRNDNPQLINGTYYTYDFTVYKAKAHDRAQLDEIKNVAHITIPQYSVRLGAFLNDKQDIGFELNYDHAKYVVEYYQKVRVKGHVNGQYFDQDTILDPNTFLHYEHTDGANFFMFTFMKRYKFLNATSGKHLLSWVVKPGLGFVYPRTDVTIFGSRVNNDWKISGVIGGLETGLRYEFFKHGYLELTGKGGRANYINTLVQGKGYGRASNSFWFFEAIAILGYQFNINRSSEGSLLRK